MKKVCLQFPDLYQMWLFAKTLSSNFIEINTYKKTLICDCKEEHIADAIATYKAKVVEFQKD